MAAPHSGYSSPLIWFELEFDLGSKMGPKLKAKIWADEFIALPTSFPNQDRYAVSLTPSSNPSNQPRLILEPYQPSKNIHSFLHWLSAFNIFVAILSQKFRH